MPWTNLKILKNSPVCEESNPWETSVVSLHKHTLCKEIGAAAVLWNKIHELETWSCTKDSILCQVCHCYKKFLPPLLQSTQLLLLNALPLVLFSHVSNVSSPSYKYPLLGKSKPLYQAVLQWFMVRNHLWFTMRHKLSLHDMHLNGSGASNRDTCMVMDEGRFQQDALLLLPPYYLCKEVTLTYMQGFCSRTHIHAIREK